MRYAHAVRALVLLLLALLMALGGASLDLCACAPGAAPVAQAMDEGCCCCVPEPARCDEPAAPSERTSGPALEAACGCGRLELPAPTAETTVATASVEAPATVVLTLAPSRAADLRALDARALGPPDDPGRRRHLLLHVLRC